ncbi:MAG: hypothetical protein E6Q97_36645 [Desulfurellales bacterium]|nr:MAG: hypothetical protein E6Q97_36645 [Desulfurellales bacterium]
MANLLDSVTTRLHDIIANGRGTAVTFSSHARNVISIAAGVFRPSKSLAPLNDPALGLAEIDRAYSIVWREQDYGWDEYNNTQDAIQTQAVYFELLNGVVYGAHSTEFVIASGGEVAADVIRFDYASQRVLGDAYRIMRALTFGELYEGDTDPLIKRITRNGRVTTENGNGRMFARTTFRVDLDVVGMTRYAP